MTEQEILEGNKLIAEFMDIPFVNGVWDLGSTDSYPDCHPMYNIPGDWFHYSSEFEKHELPFNNSWDWLMPVVEKIWKMGHSFIWEGNSDEHYFYNSVAFGEDSWLRRFQEMPIKGEKYDTESLIESLYSSVIEFIKWYNKRKEDSDE